MARAITFFAMRTAIFLLGTFWVFANSALSAPLPSDCSQLIVGLADSWDANVGRIQCFERDGKTWRAVSAPQRVLFGTNGLAWGIGVAGQNEPGKHKVESDKRAPAGLFALGKVYTYETALPAGSDYPFFTVTPADCWIEDPALPGYNTHVRVDPANPPPWFKKQQMKQDDFAHHWKIEILHNSNPPQPGAGSAIFFHIQRGPNKHSSGCTTMPQPALLSIIRWLRADEHPHYVLLPAAEYRAKWKAWGLPSPALVGAGR
jgi:L,D-peptidoglycan transpeptidase YkuD (ErfK/YbiS/YcfS/YnhG family)